MTSEAQPDGNNPSPRLVFQNELVALYHGDCFVWLKNAPKNSVHAVVTDPPYGLVEYTDKELEKRKNGKGGIWRIPPSHGNSKRAPLPRFTVFEQEALEDLYLFFREWASLLMPVMVPGAHVMIATNPMVSVWLYKALGDAGLEPRGEIVRLVMTLRGGDRPKGAHEEYPDVSVLPRSKWEPWGLFRKPVEGRVADNLKKWNTGGLRRKSQDEPFADVIHSGRTPKKEKELAPHPSLKPQAFLRQLVRASLPLGEGVLLDPFAGSGSTLAAATAIGYRAIGVEVNMEYVDMAALAIPKLSRLPIGPERMKEQLALDLSGGATTPVGASAPRLL